METKRIEGVVELCENGNVQFMSGLPENELVVTWPLLKRRGVMTPFKNGDVTFIANGPCGALPPEMDLVLRSDSLVVKRSSRSYIVTMKLPIMESAEATTRGHSSMWKKAYAAIKANREEIKEAISR